MKIKIQQTEKKMQKHEKTVKNWKIIGFRVLGFGKPQGGINRRPIARNNPSTRMPHNFCSMRSFSKRKNALDSPHSQLSNAFVLLKNDLMEQKLWLPFLSTGFSGLNIFYTDIGTKLGWFFTDIDVFLPLDFNNLEWIITRCRRGVVEWELHRWKELFESFQMRFWCVSGASLARRVMTDSCRHLFQAQSSCGHYAWWRNGSHQKTKRP